MRKSTNGRATGRKAQIRCAIYTRKSSDEGLEQDFNSLDAQREACEPFITSQKHEGWVCLAGALVLDGLAMVTGQRRADSRNAVARVLRNWSRCPRFYTAWVICGHAAAVRV